MASALASSSSSSATLSFGLPTIARSSSSLLGDRSSTIASFGTTSFSRQLSFSPLSFRSPGKCGRPRIVAMTSSGDTSDPSEALQDVLKSVQEAWDKTEDKLAIGGLGFASLIVLWASTGLISAIDKLPLIPNLFELVGIVFTGWFIYRYLLFKPDREELLKSVEITLSKITGGES